MTIAKLSSLCLRGHEVRALLKDGRATVMRVMEPQPQASPMYAYSTAMYPDEDYSRELGATFSGFPIIPGRWWFADASGPRSEHMCPFGKVGDRLLAVSVATHVEYDGAMTHPPTSHNYSVGEVEVEAVRGEQSDGVWQWLGEMRRVEC
jgi:hypothetical protein